MNIISEIDNLELPFKYEKNVSFRRSSWFGVGGTCDVVFKINSIEDLSVLVKSIPLHIPILPIGVTSNLLIRDEGFQGVIVRPRFSKIQLLDNNQVEVGSGLLDKTIAQFALQHSLSGLEFLYTIPGTMGGAIAMNAGCYGNELSDILVSVTGVNRLTGEIKVFHRGEINFSYRENPIKGFIWTSAILQGKKNKSKEEIQNLMDKFQSQRVNSQPRGKTAGSTFCNPPNYKVWELLDAVELRGHRIGGAHFSDKHCNFIVNDDHASAQDIIDLIEIAEKLILEKYEIVLKREIVVV